MYLLKNIKHGSKYAMIALLLTVGVLFSASVSAALPQNRQMTISESTQDASGVTYATGFVRPNTGLIGSFELEICSNDPFPGTACTVPAGFSFSSSTITSQVGITDFSINAGSTSNKLIFSRVPSVVANGFMGVTVNNVHNPSNSGSYYARIRTFASNDATGVSTDEGGLAFAINRRVNVTAEVPPFLYLCVANSIPGFDCSLATGNFVNLGELSPYAANAGTSQFLIATNAGQGFTVTVIGTPPTSGNNEIAAMASSDVSIPGKNQFGINLTANSSPGAGQNPVGPGVSVPSAGYNVPNVFRFVPGESLVISHTTSDYRKFTVTYLVNVNRNQTPGIYNTVILYVALATF